MVCAKVRWPAMPKSNVVLIPLLRYGDVIGDMYSKSRSKHDTGERDEWWKLIVIVGKGLYSGGLQEQKS